MNASKLENKKIVVLMGGPGSEREVSLHSGAAVLKALIGAGYHARGLDLQGTSLNIPADADLVYNVIHGSFGEDGQLQEQLEQLKIPYTGAGSRSSRLAFDKNLAKQAFLDHGVPTPASEILDCSKGIVFPSFSAPFVVKPPREGSSVGISIVHSQEEAEAALTKATQFSSDLLVEKYIAGKELTVGILNDAVLPVVQIVPRTGFYDISNKYPWMGGGAGSDYFCPADLDAEVTAKVQAAALAAHRALGVEVYSRVDVLLDQDNQPYVLEANTIPGMTETSLLPKAAAAQGISFTELCVMIAELSLARFH